MTMRDRDYADYDETERMERAAQHADREAEIHYPDADLRDADFLAPRRRRRSTIPDPTDALSPEERAQVREWNLYGGPSCKGDRT